jgi:hypothetical protein
MRALVCARDYEQKTKNEERSKQDGEDMFHSRKPRNVRTLRIQQGCHSDTEPS